MAKSKGHEQLLTETFETHIKNNDQSDVRYE